MLFKKQPSVSVGFNFLSDPMTAIGSLCFTIAESLIFSYFAYRIFEMDLGFSLAFKIFSVLSLGTLFLSVAVWSIYAGVYCYFKQGESATKRYHFREWKALLFTMITGAPFIIVAIYLAQ